MHPCNRVRVHHPPHGKHGRHLAEGASLCSSINELSLSADETAAESADAASLGSQEGPGGFLPPVGVATQSDGIITGSASVPFSFGFALVETAALRTSSDTSIVRDDDIVRDEKPTLHIDVVVQDGTISGKKVFRIVSSHKIASAEKEEVQACARARCSDTFVEHDHCLVLPLELIAVAAHNIQERKTGEGPTKMDH